MAASWKSWCGFALVAAALAGPAAAATERWSLLGPYGGGVETLAVHPSDSQVIYAGSLAAGVYKSTDGGASWTSLATGPAAALLSARVTSLAINPSVPSTVWAGIGTQLWKTADNGFTWTALSIPEGPVRAIAPNPRAPRNLFAATPSFVLSSADGGANWTPETGSPSQVRALVLEPETNGTLYAGTPSGVFRTLNGATPWVQVGAATLASPVNALAFDPRTSRRLYAATDAGVFVSKDRGDTWESAPGPTGALSLAVVPGVGGLLYAGTPSGLYRSTDGGGSWTRLDGLADGATVAVAALVADPTGSGAVLAGTDGGDRIPGFFKSGDGGTTWAASNRGFSTLAIDRVLVDPSNPRRLFASGPDGIFRTAGPGEEWIFMDPPRPAGHPVTVPLLALAGVPTRVYAGPTGAGEALNRFTLGGHWEALGDAASLPAVRALAVDPLNLDILYLGGATGFARSTDSGATWSRTAGEIAQWNVDRLKFQTGSTVPTLYAFASSPLPLPDPPTAFFRSTDRGVSFVHTGQGLPTAIIDVAVTGAPAGRIDLLAKSGLYRSLDAGDTWTFVSAPPAETPHPRISPYTALAIDSQGRIYVGTAGQGVVLSTDDGATWSAVPAGLPPGPVAALVPGALPGTVLAATQGGVQAFPAAALGCAPGSTVLCLNGARFSVSVGWKDFSGRSGVGQAVPLTDDTGFFWFFDPANVELTLKVLDGRALNSHFWVFYGALSTVDYTIFVTDSMSGGVKTYHNPAGTLASAADTAAF